MDRANNYVCEHNARNQQKRNEQKSYKTLQGFDEYLSFGFLMLRIGRFAFYNSYDYEHEQQDHPYQKHTEKCVSDLRRRNKMRQYFFLSASVDIDRFYAGKFTEHVADKIQKVTDRFLQRV